MNKRARRIVASTLMAAMTMSAGIPAAFAADTVTLTAPSTAKHTYKIYQVFTGTVDGKTIADAKWGGDSIGDDAADKVKDGVKGEAQSSVSKTVLDDLKGVNNSLENARLSTIKKYVDLDGKGDVYNTVLSPNGTVEVAPGYYVIEDITTVNGVEKSSYITMLVSAENNTFEAKSSVPTVDKQVSDEENDGSNKVEGALNDNNTPISDADKNGIDDAIWAESADHEIGETFKFRLTAQLPTDAYVAEYEKYKLTFNDTLSAGITFDQITAVRYQIPGKDWVTIDVADDTDLTNGYVFSEFSNDKANGTATWTFNDLVKIVGDSDGNNLQGLKVEIVYSAHLNKDAIITSGTTGETDEVNKNKVNLTFSRNPNQDGHGTPGDDTTPDDYVFVFTYDQVNQKVDANKDPLAKAVFQVLDKENKAIDLVYVGTVDGREVYRLATTEDEGTAKSVLKTENGKTVIDETIAVNANDKVSEIKTTANGYFVVRGLDKDQYYIKELVAPEGYTPLTDNIDVAITQADHKEGSADVTKAQVTALKRTAGDVNQVINKTESELPETGGIGTVLFYTIGGLMAIGSSVVLFGKRIFNR